MSIAPITTIVPDAMQLLLQQYKDRPFIGALFVAALTRLQEAEDAVWATFYGRLLAYAVGAQLAGLGELVGAPPPGGLSDDQYRPFVIGSIAANYSDGTLERFLPVVATLYGARNVYVQTPNSPGAHATWPAFMGIGVGSPSLDPTLFDTAQKIVQTAVAGGVGLAFVTEFDADGALSTDGPQPWVRGCSSLDDPDNGGAVGSLLYVNTAS